MRLRIFFSSAAIIALSAFPSSSRAQCVTLGTPGLSGCGPLGAAPTLVCASCNGFTTASSPNIGNSGFVVAAGFPSLVGTPVLMVGPCAVPPLLVPAGACLGGTVGCICSASPQGCNAFVGYVHVPFAGALWCPAIGYANPWQWFFNIPNDPALIGGALCAQAIGSTSGGFPNPTCLAISNGLQITILP